MLRFTSRFLGYWLMAAALIAAVVDGAKSIAASQLVVTPLGETWAAIAAFGGSADAPAEPLMTPGPLPWPLDLASAWLAAAPTVAALGVCGILLLVAGRKRRRPLLGREFAT